MLKELLRLLEPGSAVRVETIAEELDITRGFVTALLEDLHRRDYLRIETSGRGCQRGCSACSRKETGRRSSRTPKRWCLTEKGRRCLEKDSESQPARSASGISGN